MFQTIVLVAAFAYVNAGLAIGLDDGQGLGIGLGGGHGIGIGLGGAGLVAAGPIATKAAVVDLYVSLINLEFT